MRGKTHRIVAPHFNAGIVVFNNVVREAAPILKYMTGWHIAQVRSYCGKNGWKVSTIEKELDMVNNSILVSHDQYYDMLDKSLRYDALKAAGVDNWEGYGDCMRALYDEKLGEEGADTKEAAETAPEVTFGGAEGDEATVRQPDAVDSGTPTA